MEEEAIGFIGAQGECEETTEYDNRIENEVEPEEEQDDLDSRKNWGEIEQQFARYERNYRARRIRELTLAPIKKKRSARKIDRETTEIAA